MVAKGVYEIESGLRISWSISTIQPPLEVTLSEVGSSVSTPGFHDDIFDEEFYKLDRSYNSELKFPDNLNLQVGAVINGRD